MQRGPDYYAKECYCRKIRAVTARITRIYDERLKEAGITCQQFSALECIRALEPVSVTELSGEMGLDRTSLSRNLKVMKSGALIEDQEGSGRSRRITLSEHGKAVLQRAEEQWELAQRDLEALFGPGRLKHLKALTKFSDREDLTGGEDTWEL